MQSPATKGNLQTFAETLCGTGNSVRADLDGGSLAIEYDADILQATGEDWTNVALTLSTARPSLGGAAPAGRVVARPAAEAELNVTTVVSSEDFLR